MIESFLSRLPNVAQQMLMTFPAWGWLLLATVLYCYFRCGEQSHMSAIASSRFRLRYLKRRCLTPQAQFGYLRVTNPFVFEEMILSALKQQGHSITRNRRYTGDGGIDGRAKINNKRVLIQAKRYKSHINRQHVIDFVLLCKKYRCYGLFVHTGRTGKAARQAANSEYVDIVSGDRLLSLMTGKGFTPRWTIH